MRVDSFLFGRLARAVLAGTLTTAAAVLAAEDQAAKTVVLSSEISRVVKMHEAGLDDGVLKAYLENCRTLSTPTVEEIVHMHSLKISDPVILAAIQNANARSEPTASSTAAAPVANAAPPASQATVVYSQSPVVYAQPAPVYVSPSVAYYDYGYWGPSYYRYYGYGPGYCGGYYPAISLGFAFGGGRHYYGHGYHAGGIYRVGSHSHHGVGHR